VAKSWIDSKSTSRTYFTSRVSSWDGWPSDNEFILSDFLRDSLDFLESALQTCGDTKPSKGDLEWYKQQVETTFRMFSKEGK
jgi:hypothetical protein